MPVYLANPPYDHVRYFIQRCEPKENESKALDEDKEKAKTYEWRARSRSTGHQKSTVYFRNFSIDVGQPASFEEREAKLQSALDRMINEGLDVEGSLNVGSHVQVKNFLYNILCLCNIAHYAE